MNEPGSWQEIVTLLRDSLSSTQDIYGSLMQLSEQLAANHSALSENISTVLQILENGYPEPTPPPQYNQSHGPCHQQKLPTCCPCMMPVDCAVGHPCPSYCQFYDGKQHERTVLCWSSLPFWQG